MASDFINLSIPRDLHHILKDHADTKGMGLTEFINMLLQEHIPRAEQMASPSQLLAHPKFAPTKDRATINIEPGFDTRLQALVTRIKKTITTRKGHVLQAILWQAVLPEALKNPPPASSSPTQRILIPDDMHRKLSYLADQQRKTLRSITDKIIELVELDWTNTASRAEIAQQQIANLSSAPSKAMRVAQEHEAFIEEVAITLFDGVKAHAFQAILAYGLDQGAGAPEEGAEPPITDQPVLIDAPLYQEIVEIIHTTPIKGVRTIRQFVNRAVQKEIQRLQRLQRTSREK